MSQNNTLHSSSSEAAESLRASLYGGVILENFNLRQWVFATEAPASLTALEQDEAALRSVVGEMVEKVCRGQGRPEAACAHGRAMIAAAPLSIYAQSTAAREFADWLYALDGDNWFPLQTALDATRPYFASSNVVLKMFRGFNPDGVLVDLLSTTDLPVVLNLDEGTLALWTNELAD